MTTTSIATRRLTIEDYEAVAKLYQTADRWMETEMSKEFFAENLAVARSQYLEGDPARFLLGTFFNDELVLTGGMYFWDKMPFCTILRFVGKLESASTISIAKCMISLFNAFLDELQRNNRTRFYLLTSGHHLSTLSKLGTKIPRLGRDYLMTVEAVVAPNARPRDEYVWSMMGHKTWPVPLVLRAGTAYNHARSFDKTIVDEEILNAWSSRRFEAESAEDPNASKDEL